jgi:hypothetical protein
MAERVTDQTEMFVRSIRIPSQTETYSPVSHGDVIDELELSLKEKGLVPFKKKFITAKDGQELFGSWMLKGINDDVETVQKGDQVLAINFVNSYNKHLKLSIVPGIAVIVCGNGAMSKTAVSTFSRKHTGDINIEFPIFIQNSLENLDTLYQNMILNFAKLKEVQLDKKLMSELAGRLFIEHDIISSEQMSMLKREIEKPTFEQFIPQNAYSLYNHTTYSLRNSHPAEIIEKYTNVHEFFEQEFLV